MDIISRIQSLRAMLSEKPQINVGVWGDSVFLGVVQDDSDGRYRISKDNAVNLCSQALKATIENFSKFGCTVIKGRQRLVSYLEKDKSCDVAILEYGGNDCDMPWTDISANPVFDHQPKVTLKTFSSNLQEMINLLLARGIIPLLTTLPPLHHERYLNWICSKGLKRENILHFLGESHRIYRHHERYSLEVSKLAMENDCHVVDVRSAFLDNTNYQELLCEDGIHPNDKGQMLIREAFMSFVDKHMPGMRLSPRHIY